jgi:hypothetical protein
LAAYVKPFFPSGTVRLNGKTRQKLILKQVVKLTHHSYASNSLTNFGFAMTGNGNFDNLA